MESWSNTRALFALLALFQSAEAATKTDKLAFARSICTAVETSAAAHGLDRDFFARLLWKESLFDPNAISPKGAQGIAQFMPETAARRNLADPFEPLGAVAASASFLSDLKKQFGNLGLAAAAYNAGEERVSDWLAGKRGLPAESQDYVASITGRAAEEWRQPATVHPIPSLEGKGDFTEQCVALASRQATLTANGSSKGRQQPYGVLLAANLNEGKALAMYRRLKLRFPVLLNEVEPMVAYKRNLSRGSRRIAFVMVGANSHEEARQLCRRYLSAGLPCVARKNR
jgi:soluble lytic murein transglycosylase-like protein